MAQSSVATVLTWKIHSAQSWLFGCIVKWR